MARLARAVFPGHPHHVTQRGNGRATTFFEESDYALYRDLLAEHAGAAGVEVWAWVLMPNHVHLILVPNDADGLRRALAPVHRRYAGHVHARLKRTGHFWQGRFGCVAMDEAHFGAALRYVAMNPVRAGLVERAIDWPWSSARAQLGEEGGITATVPVRERFPDFAALLASAEDEEMTRRLRRAETIGRPIGSDDFVRCLERESNRRLAPARRGRRPREIKCTVTVISVRPEAGQRDHSGLASRAAPGLLADNPELRSALAPLVAGLAALEAQIAAGARAAGTELGGIGAMRCRRSAHLKMRLHSAMSAAPATLNAIHQCARQKRDRNFTGQLSG